MEQTSNKRPLEDANQDAPAKAGQPTKQAKISTFFVRGTRWLENDNLEKHLEFFSTTFSSPKNQNFFQDPLPPPFFFSTR
jgi:hypothetical protein